MNAKVEEFISKMKKEQKEEELRQREALLISIGLVDETKSIELIEYLDVYDNTPECKWDAEEGKYFKVKKEYLPIEVTDEEYQELLKYVSIEKKEEINGTSEIEKTWSNTISLIANIFLVISIIAGLCLINEYGWISIVIALIYCVLWYPLIIGFSKIVAVAEKKLK